MTLRIGQQASMTRSYSDADVDRYVALGGHTAAHDEVPEALINALFSRLLGVELPGRGSNYLKQESEFFERARVGEILTASVEVSRLRPEKHLVDLRTRCTGARGRLISEGRALVYVADVAQQ